VKICIRELAINVDCIETSDEVNKDIVDPFWHLLKKDLGNLFVGRILRKIDWNEKFLCLCVDIANINTTLMCKIDPIALGPVKLAFGLINLGLRLTVQRQRPKSI
jgi:hypothetical protein